MFDSGYPFVQTYHDELTIVGTPVYAAPGCDGPTYRSALMVPSHCEEESVAELLRCHAKRRVPLKLGANSIDSFSVSLMMTRNVS